MQWSAWHPGLFCSPGKFPVMSVSRQHFDIYLRSIPLSGTDLTKIACYEQH
jgi:hypothetical protein